MSKPKTPLPKGDRFSDAPNLMDEQADRLQRLKLPPSDKLASPGPLRESNVSPTSTLEQSYQREFVGETVKLPPSPRAATCDSCPAWEATGKAGCCHAGPPVWDGLMFTHPPVLPTDWCHLHPGRKARMEPTRA